MSRYVNPGGAAGDVYRKISSTDYDAGWTDIGLDGGAAGQVPVKASATDFDFTFISKAQFVEEADIFRSDSVSGSTAYSTNGSTWVNSGIQIDIPGFAAGYRWLGQAALRIETDRGIDIRLTLVNGSGWAARVWYGYSNGLNGTPEVERDGFATAGYNFGGTTGIYGAHHFISFPFFIYTNVNAGSVRVEYKSGGSSGAGSGARFTTGAGIWAWRAPFP